MRSRAFAALAAVMTLFSFAREAKACAVCASGDATMRPREASRPVAGTFGAAVDVRAGSLAVQNTVRLSEWRSEASMHVTLNSTVRLRLAVPVLARQIVGIPVDEGRQAVMGDVIPSVDAVVSEAREGKTTRTTAITLGLGLPTAPATTDARGLYLPSMLQPGCNSIIPEAQVSYRLQRGELSFTVSPRARLPMPVRAAPHRGAMVALGLGAQYQPHPRFAARLTTVARYELEGANGDGRGDGISGGFVGYLAPEVVVRPTMDLALTLGMSAPVVQALGGNQRESVVFSAGLAWEI